MSQSDAQGESICLTIVAARAKNGVIGRGGALPWRLSSDLKHFKAFTLGKPLIMGRKTFLSLGKPLPGRETIILTRTPGFKADGALVASSVEKAIEIARERAQKMNAREIIIAGGGDVYRAFLPLAGRAVITQIDLVVEGDAWFAPLDSRVWRLVEQGSPEKGPNDDANFTIETYEKRYFPPRAD